MDELDSLFKRWNNEARTDSLALAIASMVGSLCEIPASVLIDDCDPTGWRTAQRYAWPDPHGQVEHRRAVAAALGDTRIAAAPLVTSWGWREPVRMGRYWGWYAPEGKYYGATTPTHDIGYYRKNTRVTIRTEIGHLTLIHRTYGCPLVRA